MNPSSRLSATSDLAAANPSRQRREPAMVGKPASVRTPAPVSPAANSSAINLIDELLPWNIRLAPVQVSRKKAA